MVMLIDGTPAHRVVSNALQHRLFIAPPGEKTYLQIAREHSEQIVEIARLRDELRKVKAKHRTLIAMNALRKRRKLALSA